MEIQFIYSSGPDSGTPENREFPVSGTEKGVRNFLVPKRYPSRDPLFLKATGTAYELIHRFSNFFTLNEQVVRHIPVVAETYAMVLLWVSKKWEFLESGTKKGVQNLVPLSGPLLYSQLRWREGSGLRYVHFFRLKRHLAALIS